MRYELEKDHILVLGTGLKKISERAEISGNHGYRR
jgi:hypothetical protein